MAALIPHTSSQDKVSGPSLPPGPDLDILLVGKTGHGKSATANSILGEEAFQSDGATMSVTTSAAIFQKAMDGRKLLVVDTPGLSDTEITDPEKARKKAEADFSFAISLSPEGFHAILLAFRYGQRMSPEEVDAIKEMKSLLGENFIKDHGILLFTYGDNFKKKMKGQKSFKTWCEEQKGFMQVVLQECQNRCLIFDNEGDEGELKQQRFELVQMIDGLKGGRHYDGGIFKLIKEKWKTEGDFKSRKIYLSSCQIYSDIAGLEKTAKVYDQKFVDEMRRQLEKLKLATKDLRRSERNKVYDEIKKSEEKLVALEVKIKASNDGCVERVPGSTIILVSIGGLLAIIAAGSFSPVLAISAAIVAAWTGLLAVGVSVIRRCGIQ